MAKGLSDFLFQGSAPPNITTTANTTTQVPQWLTDYMRGVLSNANTVATQPYQPYKGQRLAKPNDALKQSWDIAMQQSGSYRPMFDQAGQTLSGLRDDSALGAAQPWIGAAGGINPLALQGGYAGGANQQAWNAAGNAFAGQNAAQPWMGGAGMNINAAGNNAFAGFNAGNPYFQAASGTVPQGIDAYMNPYQNAVVDQIAQKGTRNLQENILPGMGDMFIRAGQVGSSRHIGEMGKAMRDTQEAISNAQGQALAQGYNTSAGLLQNDLARQAQIGAQTGQLANMGVGNLLNAGTALGQIGGTLGNLANLGVGNTLQSGNLMNQIGQGMAQTGLGQMSQYGDLAQLTGNLSSIDTKNQMDLAGALQQLGRGYQTAGLNEAAAFEAVGRGQMGEQQKNLDLAYEDFLRQREYPRSNIDWMAALTRGQPTFGGSVYSTQNKPLEGAQYGPTGLGQIAGALSFMNMLGSGKKRGGFVDYDDVIELGPDEYEVIY